MIAIKILEKDSSPERFFYIGASDHITEGKWKTSKSNFKSDAHFLNWGRGEPNNAGGDEDCAVMDKNNYGIWIDIRCSDKRPFVCQLSE